VTIKVRRSTEKQVDTYHVGEAYPQGRVDKIVIVRTGNGYFAMITQKEGPPLRFNEYLSWGEFKSDLIKCLRDELECPEFDKETQLCPPFLKRSDEAQEHHASTTQVAFSERAQRNSQQS
jgi:hypothetical protein